jgi:hypothetical protein
LFSDAEPIPAPDAPIWGSVLAWAGWSTASLAWSINPEYSRAEIRTEVVWGLATVLIFYVVARSDTAFRAVIATAVAMGGLLAGLAFFRALAIGAFDPDHALSRSHGGVGAFSTYIVLAMPLVPLLLAPRPLGFGKGPWTIGGGVLVFVLLLVAARLTENRMIWVAFAAGFLLAALLPRGVGGRYYQALWCDGEAS